MNFLHYELDLDSDDVVEATLDKQANVRLLDPANYADYRDGKPHRYHGGLAKKPSVRLRPPRAGRWHLVIDLGGYPGTVRASVRTLRGQHAGPASV